MKIPNGGAISGNSPQLKLLHMALWSDAAGPGENLSQVQCDGADARTIAGHVRLLIEKNLLEGEFVAQLGDAVHRFAA